MKVSEKIAQAVAAKQPFFSFEFFPPKTDQGLVNLYDRIERMSKLGPLFVAITWGAGGATSERSLELCGACQSVFGIETVLHLTCTNMDKSKLDSALEAAKNAGIQNILALRGDTPRDAEYWSACSGGFSYAVDLVKYVREQYGDYFCIGVAGYPEGHTENNDKEQDFEFLCDKVEAGADFVVSQLVYDPRTFVEWEQRCRKAGIEVPILPGVLPVQSYQAFRRLLHLTKVSVPEPLRQALDSVKSNDQAVRDLGVDHAVQTIKSLHEAGILGVHLTTLNLESTVQRVLERLEMTRKPLNPDATATTAELSPMARAARSALPPASAANDAPATQGRVWDDFPNGRWGDARSPAFGGLNPYGEMLKFDPRGAALVWGHPRSLDDISNLFVRYVKGEIPSLPWSDEPLMAETAKIRSELIRINSLGYWTLASQPALDGVASDHELHGWGPRGGYIYQKAFVECFVPAERFPEFLSRIQSAPNAT
ncbi:methylenetetrahydrofolate reductase 1, partial [Linderina macrospora]